VVVCVFRFPWSAAVVLSPCALRALLGFGVAL